MKTNIGNIKSIISKRLVNSFMKTGQINESKFISSKFFDVLKNSPYLQLEFKIMNNIENKYITNDTLATRYIDKNIGLATTFSETIILEEYKKLEQFIVNNINEGNLENIKYVDLLEKSKLYESISNLIIENKKQLPDVDLLHESFECVLTHVKTNKHEEINEEETIIPENINGDMLIELAVNKFNEKYDSLNEDELKLVQRLITLDNVGKEKLLTKLKEDIVHKLEEGDNNGIEDKINVTIDKIKKIQFTEATVIKDITNLYDFKKNIL